MPHTTKFQDELRTGEDPTKAVLSKSSLNSKHLCDYVINVATGCRHGCKFCYVPSTPNIRARPDMLETEVGVQNSQKEWGSYVLYREGLPEKLDGHLERKRIWRETEQGCGIVGISFSTDCYMDGRAGRITQEVVEILSKHKRYARVLTRNPILALQDHETFEEAGQFITIGSSIPTLDRKEAAAIEPAAPAPKHRLRGLNEFNKLGVQTFVSMSPTYPTLNRDSLRELLIAVSECNPSVIFHEPINPRAGNFEMCVQAAQDAGELNLARQLEHLQNTENWVEYAVSHLMAVQEIGEDLDLPIHLWPDQELVKQTEPPVSNWLEAWQQRQSPENFAGRDTSTEYMPQIPKLQQKLISH